MDYIKVYKDINSRTMTKQNAIQRLSLADKRFFSDHQNKLANAIHKQTKLIQFKKNILPNYVVSNDDTVCVENSQKLFTVNDKISEANRILSSQGADIELTGGTQNKINGQDYKEVILRNKKNGTGGGITVMTTPADCGNTSALVLGMDRSVVFRPYRTPTTMYSGMWLGPEAMCNPAGMKIKVFQSFFAYMHVTDSNPMIRKRIEKFNKDIALKHGVLRGITPKSGNNAFYSALMDLADQYSTLFYELSKKHDRKALGIDEFAKPRIGQGLTISTAHMIPRRDFPFHWAGVIMESDDHVDYVTLENYANGLVGDMNSNWRLNMHDSVDTFHVLHQSLGQHGTQPTTMVVEGRRRKRIPSSLHTFAD